MALLFRQVGNEADAGELDGVAEHLKKFPDCCKVFILPECSAVSYHIIPTWNTNLQSNACLSLFVISQLGGWARKKGDCRWEDLNPRQ